MWLWPRGPRGIKWLPDEWLVSALAWRSPPFRAPPSQTLLRGPVSPAPGLIFFFLRTSRPPHELHAGSFFSRSHVTSPGSPPSCLTSSGHCWVLSYFRSNGGLRPATAAWVGVQRTRGLHRQPGSPAPTPAPENAGRCSHKHT